MRYPKFSVTIPIVTVVAAAVWSFYSPVAAQDFLIGNVHQQDSGSAFLDRIAKQDCRDGKATTRAARIACASKSTLVASNP